MAMPTAPLHMTQNGIATLVAIAPEEAAETIAASGPTAFATSFDPWAKDNNAVEQISGIVNNVRIDLKLKRMNANTKLGL